MACCIKSIAMSRPNNSPAIRVNRLIMEQAPSMAIRNSKAAVQTHTLQYTKSMTRQDKDKQVKQRKNCRGIKTRHHENILQVMDISCASVSQEKIHSLFLCYFSHLTRLSMLGRGFCPGLVVPWQSRTWKYTWSRWALQLLGSAEVVLPQSSGWSRRLQSTPRFELPSTPHLHQIPSRDGKRRRIYECERFALMKIWWEIPTTDRSVTFQCTSVSLELFTERYHGDRRGEENVRGGCKNPAETVQQKKCSRYTVLLRSCLELPGRSWNGNRTAQRKLDSNFGTVKLHSVMFLFSLYTHYLNPALKPPVQSCL